MKTTYVFGAILACGVLGTVIGNRSTKTALLAISGGLGACHSPLKNAGLSQTSALRHIGRAQCHCADYSCAIHTPELLMFALTSTVTKMAVLTLSAGLAFTALDAVTLGFQVAAHTQPTVELPTVVVIGYRASVAPDTLQAATQVLANKS